MLRQTMQNIHRNTSNTPRKIKSSFVSPSPPTHPDFSRHNLRTQYIASSSHSNFHRRNQRGMEYQKSRVLTNNSADRKPSPHHIKVQTFRDTLTSEQWSSAFPRAQNEQASNVRVNNPVNAVEGQRSDAGRSLLNMRNSELLVYQQQIIRLEEELSESLSDKLGLELKLNKSLNRVEELTQELITCKRELQDEMGARGKSNHSLTLESHAETITKLLVEYDQTKNIIQKLIEDNEILSKRNDELRRYEEKYRRVNQDFQKHKMMLVQAESERRYLKEQVGHLSQDLDLERSSKYSLLRQAEGQSKEVLSSEVQRYQREISILSGSVATLERSLRSSDLVIQEMGAKIQEMNRQNEEMVIILSRKDEEILGLSEVRRDYEDALLALEAKEKEIRELRRGKGSPGKGPLSPTKTKSQQILPLGSEVGQIEGKLKQMLKQLMTFSEALEAQRTQKQSLITEYHTYKALTEEEIARLREQLLNNRSYSRNSPIINTSQLQSTTIYIQVPDLKGTKTRVTGGYQEIILGKSPPVPVVTHVRTVAQDQNYDTLGF